MPKFSINLKVFSLVLSLGVLAFLFFPRLNSDILFPDSSSYIGHDSSRSLVYPYFLDVVGPKLKPGQAYTSSDYHRVSWVQWALVLITAFLFFLYLYRESKFAWSPILFVGFFVGHKLVFPNASMVGNVTLHNSFILTEGLVPTWVFLITALLLLYFSKKSIASAISLGFVLFLGVELTPRFLFLSVLCFFPILFEIGKAKFGKRAFLPLLIFLSLYMGKCTWTYLNFGVFSTVPFDGITLMGPAVEFSSEEDIARFSDEKEKKFVEAIVKDSRRKEPCLYSAAPGCPSPWGDPFIIRNQYIIALENYKKIVDPTGSENMNLFLSKVGKKLLLGNPQNLKRWVKWMLDSLWFLYTSNAYFTFIHLVLFLGLSWVCLVKPSDSVFFWTALALLTAHLSHTMAVSLISFPERRYLTSSEMFIPFVMLFVLLGWHKRNATH